MTEQANVMTQAMQRVADLEGGISSLFHRWMRQKRLGRTFHLPRGNETILLVDDEQVLVDLAREILSIWAMKSCTG